MLNFGHSDGLTAVQISPPVPFSADQDDGILWGWHADAAEKLTTQADAKKCNFSREVKVADSFSVVRILKNRSLWLFQVQHPVMFVKNSAIFETHA